MNGRYASVHETRPHDPDEKRARHALSGANTEVADRLENAATGV
jgi:hypothetical protein